MPNETISHSINQMAKNVKYQGREYVTKVYSELEPDFSDSDYSSVLDQFSVSD